MQTLPANRQLATIEARHSSEQLTDEQIARRVLGGDVQMFETLMRRYNGRLYRVARAILQDDALAEDAVQQAYLNAYHHLGQFEGRARFSTWLTRIVVYEALGQRKRGRDTRAAYDDDFTENLACTNPDPERQAYIGQLGTLLEATLAALPAGYRSVFLLREVDGLNTAHTAQHLRISESAVKTRLHRAKSLLQRKLRDVTPTAGLRFEGGRCDKLVEAVMSRLRPSSSE